MITKVTQFTLGSPRVKIQFRREMAVVAARVVITENGARQVLVVRRYVLNRPGYSCKSMCDRSNGPFPHRKALLHTYLKLRNLNAISLCLFG
ncbi:hypothetical protein L218DRAFT_1081601, partial [Marasmius fiardii PR-910]